MAYKFRDAQTGELVSPENIGSIKYVEWTGELELDEKGATRRKVVPVLDEEGNQIEEKIEGKTPTRKMLKLNNEILTDNFQYMPITTGDVVQYSALDMMTNSGWMSIARVIPMAATIQNPLLGSILNLVYNAGCDAYYMAGASKLASDPDKFWNSFTEKLEEVSRGPDNQHSPKNDGLYRWLSEWNVGHSYTGIGGKEALYETWDDIIGSSDYNWVNTFGLMARQITMGMGGYKTYIIDQALTDGIREATAALGENKGVGVAVKKAAIHGVASGLTAAAFHESGLYKKLPEAMKSFISKSKDAHPFIGNGAFNGLDAMAGQLGYDALAALFDSEKNYTLSDFGIDAVASFSLGAAIGMLTGTREYFKKKKDLEIKKTKEPVKTDGGEETPKTTQLEETSEDLEVKFEIEEPETTRANEMLLEEEKVEIDETLKLEEENVPEVKIESEEVVEEVVEEAKVAPWKIISDVVDAFDEDFSLKTGESSLGIKDQNLGHSYDNSCLNSYDMIRGKKINNFLDLYREAEITPERKSFVEFPYKQERIEIDADETADSILERSIIESVAKGGSVRESMESNLASKVKRTKKESDVPFPEERKSNKLQITRKGKMRKRSKEYLKQLAEKHNFNVDIIESEKDSEKLIKLFELISEYDKKPTAKLKKQIEKELAQ